MRQYVVDAFTDKVFGGNPAAVRVVETWPDDGTMLAIAVENALSETAFAMRDGDSWRLRWFTPGGEIDLCGHATLATAYALFDQCGVDSDEIAFETMGGRLAVRREGDLLEMEFPAYRLERVPVTDSMEAAFGARPSEAFLGRDLLCVFDDAATVRAMQPDQGRLEGLEGLLQHATAPGDAPGIDCVSRSFAPKLAIVEDPVCGSGHCHIAPYWAEKLGKDELTAYQASRRGGTLRCRCIGDSVFLAGTAVLYSIAETSV